MSARQNEHSTDVVYASPMLFGLLLFREISVFSTYHTRGSCQGDCAEHSSIGKVVHSTLPLPRVKDADTTFDQRLSTTAILNLATGSLTLGPDLPSVGSAGCAAFDR